MACQICSPVQEACTTVFPTVSPCVCDDPTAIRETGPAGPTGPGGETPNFAIGTVGAGNASVAVVVTSYQDRRLDWVLPAIPEGVPYTWSEVNTFTQRPVFEDGFSVTGGDTIIDGSTFDVVPDASFVADVSILGSEVVSGNLDITTDLVANGTLTVTGATTVDDLAINGDLMLTADTELTLSPTTEYIAGRWVLDECSNLKLIPLLGSFPTIKGEGTALADVNPVDVGVICAPIVFTLAASTCGPQVHPVMDVKIRIGFRMGGTPQGSLSVALWQTGVGGTLLDTYTQGDPFQAKAGCIILKAQASMGNVGANNFYVEVTNNDTVEAFIPTDVTYYFRN